MAVSVFLLSHDDRFSRELPYIGASHHGEVNGEDTLEVETNFQLTYGDRLLWQHGDVWHENVVDSFSEKHEGGFEPSYHAASSLQFDLTGKHIPYAWYDCDEDTVTSVVESLLSGTGWQVGEIGDLEMPEEVEFDVTDAYLALIDFRDALGAELTYDIEVSRDNKVTRKVNLVKELGRKTNLRFEYAHGMTGITRTVDQEPVITKCYGYGESFGSGEDSRLTFEEINGGLTYVTRDDKLEEWGIPDGKGGLLHAEGYYENPDCEEEEQLLQETKEHLDKHCEPQVTYEADIPLLALKGAEVGDQVVVVDTAFTPDVTIDARVQARDLDLMTEKVDSATFGNAVSLIGGLLARALGSEKLTQRNTAKVSGLTTSVSDLRDQLTAQDQQNATKFGEVDSSVTELKSSLEKVNENREAMEQKVSALEQVIEELKQQIEEIQNGGEGDA